MSAEKKVSPPAVPPDLVVTRGGKRQEKRPKFEPETYRPARDPELEALEGYDDEDR